MLKVDKLLQLFGIVLLFLLGLSGSEDILGKKRAWEALSGAGANLSFLVLAVGCHKQDTLFQLA